MKTCNLEILTRNFSVFKTHVSSIRAILQLALVLSLPSVIMAETAVKSENSSKQPNTSFVGCRAMVLKSDIAWNAWDSTMYGALQRKGMEVVWGEDAAIDNPTSLAQYDLIAMNIQCSFTPMQLKTLKDFLASGGAIYITAMRFYDDNLINKNFLKLCGVGSYKVEKLKNMTLLDGPLAGGFGQTKVLFPGWCGDGWHGDGIRVVSFAITEGISVAKDNEGMSLGVLKEHGLGRTALLSFSPENYKYCFPDSQIQIADRMFENTLHWLMPRGQKERPWSNVLEVSLPRRAEVRSVFLNDKPLSEPKIRAVGSLRKVSIPVTDIEPGKKATVKITYKPLSNERNIETWVHHPSGEFCVVFTTPKEAVDFLSALHINCVQPLLRGNGGLTYYRGIPGDIICDEIKAYPGDYLAEYIAELHRRGIKIVGGFYMSAQGVLDKYPEATWIGRDGKPSLDPWVCLNNPKGQEHNVDAFRQLVENYQLDGILLDDNFQIIDKPCYCQYCKDNFKIYCQRQGVEYKDPSYLTDGDIKLKEAWVQYMVSGTRAFCEKLRTICAKRGIPLGGAVNAAKSSTMHTAENFDLLVGMIYSVPPYAARGPVSILGDNKKFVNLLWALNRSPEAMEAEVDEAVRTGSPAVGFWTQFFGKDGGKENWGLYTGSHGSGKHQDYKWYVEPGGLDAIARAFGNIDKLWLSYYKDNLLAGDGRFAAESGIMKPEELTLTIRNCGQRVTQRLQGTVDITLLQ